MKKKCFGLVMLMTLTLTFLMNTFASSMDYGSKINSRSLINSNNSTSEVSVVKGSFKNAIYLDSNEAVARVRDFVKDFYLDKDKILFNKNEDEFLKFKKSRNIPLYDINSNLISYLLLQNNKYFIVDARKNGYGVLESGCDSELTQIISSLYTNKKLYYVFPSMIFTEEQLKKYINNNSDYYLESLLLPIPSEKVYNFENESPMFKNFGNEIIQLTNESSFVNVNNVYYGGNQSWFEETKLKNTGCGIVAAANITNHLSNYVRGYQNLYSYNNLSLSNFSNHMYDIEKYLSPTIIGIPSLSYFESGVKSFAKSRGVNISAYWSNDKVTKDSFADYIKSGLRRDCPVAYLQYFNSLQKDYDWHWMTITKYFRNTSNGDRHIAVSTWGERKSLSFNALWDGNFACGVLYFK